MKFCLNLLVVVTAIYHRAAEPIPDCYIVKFKSDTSEAKMAQHKANHNAAFNRAWSKVAKGYSLCTKNKNAIAQIERSPEVEYVEEDGVVRANCDSQTDAIWGLSRTSKRQLKNDGVYSYPHDGTGVTVFVLDTGINLQHEEFEGRATWGINTADSTTAQTDGHGHGTHCAGTIGGKTYGMAKNANLVAVKVLSDSGEGSYSGVIAAIDWVVSNKPAGKTSVASMSLGGGKSQALNDAINRAVAQGVVMVVAAGNDNKDACNFSPSSATAAITVGASDNTDSRALFSNTGSCVDLFAPGVAIQSAWNSDPTAVNTISGTSMACPHVAGQVAKYLESHPQASGAAVKTWLISSANQNVLKNMPKKPGTPNRLLFGDCSTFA